MLRLLNSPMERNALKAYYVLRTPGAHVLVWVAPPGTGKTSLARSVGRAIGVDDAHFLRWSVGQHGPEDFNGWPTPRANGLWFEAAAGIREINDGQMALWMYDEFNLAPRSTQGAMLKVLDEVPRRVGDTVLHPNLKIMAAMNEPEHAADAQDISKPIGNRAIWLPFQPPGPADHTKFMQGNGDIRSDLFPQWSDEKHEVAKAEVISIYTAYMTPPPHGVGIGTLLENINDPVVSSRFPLSYATPRTWDYALNLAATCRMFEDTEAMQEILTGTIGEPQALQFMSFYNDQDLIPIAKLRENPSLWRPDPRRQDRTFAQLMAVALAATNKAIPEKEKGDWWHWGWEIIRITLDSGAGDDLALVAGQHLGANKPKGRLLAEYIPVIQRLAPMVAASGFGG